MRGLLGRDGLEPGTGMLIDAAPSVHMFFMRFPIDVVFLDRDRTVVGVRHRLAPWRVAGARHAVAALELPAGAAAQASTVASMTAWANRGGSQRLRRKPNGPSPCDVMNLLFTGNTANSSLKR